MKKYLLATCLLAATHLPLLAQQATPAAPAQAAPVAPPTTLRQGQQDTLRAISRHYSRRRKGGYTWLGIGTGGLLVFVRVLANPNTTTVNGRQTSSSVDGEAAAIVGLGFVALPGLIGVSKLTRFSRTHEEEVIRAYTTTNRLPQGWGYRLLRKDF